MKLTVTDNTPPTASLEIMVTVEDTRPDLKITDPDGGQFDGIRFYKSGSQVDRNALSEGDQVKVRATIYNEANSNGALDPDSPMASGPVDSKFYVGFYVDYKYKGYKTYDASENPIAVNGTTTVEFDWTVPAGNHIVTVIANDIGKMVDERNHDNNRLDVQVGAGQIYFPDLVAMTTGTGEEETGTLTVGLSGKTGYKSSVPLSISVKNNGTAAAGPFSVSFFANGKLVASELVSGGLEAGAETTVASSFRPASGGTYKFEAMIDGPGNYIVESDETNNRQTLTAEIDMVYPDLLLRDMVITPSSGMITGD